jgi:GTP-binding protein
MKLKENSKGAPVAEFLGSHTELGKLPEEDLPEYAFIGRSNVGKSSLINMLMGNKNLAKVSATPGKTQTINHYLVDKSWYLVDLPGYGYAKISKTSRAKWEEMIRGYLSKRGNLMCVFVLIDSRIPLQKNDVDFMISLAGIGIPFVIAFTKADKLGINSLRKNIDAIKKGLLDYWEELPKTFITSAEDTTGQDEILTFIGETNLLF